MATHAFMATSCLSIKLELYARYLCSRDALGLARDDRVSCIQKLELTITHEYLTYKVIFSDLLYLVLKLIEYRMTNNHPNYVPLRSVLDDESLHFTLSNVGLSIRKIL